MFPGYYKPTPDELSALWTDALIVLDTNALFNLFRYTNTTREAFLKVLSAKSERLWLPNQVGMEFQQGRLRIIEDQSRAFTDLTSKTKVALATITKDVGSLRNHPTLDLDELKAAVDAAITSIEGKIESTREKYQAEVVDAARHDETTDVITDLYIGRVGEAYEENKLQELFEQGEVRYEGKQPPGYKDANKPKPDRYGDFILWMQLLDKAEADGTSVIFVGDDQKEDWWREFKGRKIGPRVELVDEFQARVGKRIYFLTPHALMALAKEHDAEITSDTVEEVAKVSKAQAERALIAAVIDQEAETSERMRMQIRRDDPLLTPHGHQSRLLADLTLQRGVEEAELRVLLRRAKELDAQGHVGSSEQTQITHSISRLRRRVAALSADIKELEFSHFRPQSGPLSHDDVGEELLVLVHRHLLASRHSMSAADSWLDHSPAELAYAIRHADLIDPELAEIVKRARDELAHTYRPGWNVYPPEGGEIGEDR